MVARHSGSRAEPAPGIHSVGVALNMNSGFAATRYLGMTRQYYSLISPRLTLTPSLASTVFLPRPGAEISIR